MSAVAPLRIALQGELGSFSDEAIQQLWGGDVERRPCRDLADVASAVAAGEADRGVLPLENTIVGSIAGAHDALSADARLAVVAETVVAVRHCLLAAPGVTLDTVRSVFAHPVALAQCSRFFAAHPEVDVSPAYDTAGAALDVARVADPALAVLASRRAAQRYGLAILRDDVEDRDDNQKRFIAVAAAPAPLPAGTPARTMLVLRTSDDAGALLAALSPFARHGTSIRRLESRPGGAPWTYRFFIEFDHQAGDPVADTVVREVLAAAAEGRAIGTYPRWNPGRRGSIGWRAMSG